MDFNRKFSHTDEWRPAAINYEKTGRFCPYPIGTSEYIKFWDEETRRCIEGYETPNAGYITPYHYFYLNYCPLTRLVDKEVYNYKTKKMEWKQVSEQAFPSFWDYDYYYFTAFEEAREEGEFLAVIKARRRGYSYKGASILCRGYYLFPGFVGLVVTENKEELIKEGFLSKAWDMMDFIDEYTPWSKKRQKVDTQLHRKASIITVDETGAKIETGYKSEIMGIAIGTNPNKVRGKRADIIFFEEAGKNKHLKEAWQVLRPSVSQDGVTFGIMVAFGTANSGDEAFNNLRDIFYNPGAWGCKGFDNIWDNTTTTKKCGFFVPAYTNLMVPPELLASLGFDENTVLLDNDGNTNIPNAIKYIEKLREPIIYGAQSQREIDLFVCEAPITISEACIMASGNIFPQRLCQDQLAKIRNDDVIRNMKQVGDLVYDDNGNLQWKPKKFGDILNYPMEKDENPRGAIAIWEHPDIDVRWNDYYVAVDPYSQDIGTSLGSCLVWKRVKAMDAFSDCLVAEYTGRPETSDEFHENVLKIALYYKAKVMCENNVPGLITYFRNKKMEYLLYETPDIISKILENTKDNRQYGVNISQTLKLHLLGRIKDYLLEDRGNGKKGVNMLFSEPLLMELIRYTEDENADRVSAMCMVMICRDNLRLQAERRLKEDTCEKANEKKFFFGKPVFSNEWFDSGEQKRAGLFKFR